jgi:hypothetical protein
MRPARLPTDSRKSTSCDPPTDENLARLVLVLVALARAETVARVHGPLPSAVDPGLLAALVTLTGHDPPQPARP